MTTTPVLIQEWHTSDLTDPCPRRVQLRHEGKIIGETTGALYLGNIVHEALACLWRGSSWDADAVTQCVDRGILAARDKSREERRPPSLSMQGEGGKDTEAEARMLVELYAERFRPMRERVQVIGVEAPIACVMDVDGEPVQCASHVDLIYRDVETGTLGIDDFKTGQDAPSASFLTRWIQGGLYWLWCKEGVVCTVPELGVWDSLDAFPRVRWIHMRNLKPYARATTRTVGGEQVTFKKGDVRPLDRIAMEVAFLPAQADEVRRHVVERVRMARAGVWPRVPDEQGCKFCDARMSCPGWGVIPSGEVEE